MSAIACRHSEKCPDCRRRPRTSKEKAASELYEALEIALDFMGDFESADRAHNAAVGLAKDALAKARRVES